MGGHLHSIGAHMEVAGRQSTLIQACTFDCPVLCLQRPRSLEVGEEGVGRQDDIVGRVLGLWDLTACEIP